MTPAGKHETMSDFNAKDDEPDAKKSKLIQDRIKKRGYSVTGPASWPYAGDLVISWEAIEADPDKTADRAKLKAGAKVRGEPKLVSPIEIAGGEYFYTIHPEAISISPDGKYLGVISHAFAGEFSDTFEIRIVPVAEVAGQAYNNTGLELHKKGEHAKAAALFYKAAYANPESKVAMYNLACALARLKDPATEKALSLAIAKGGDETKKKALKDADFDLVRGEAWFTTVLTK
jgi:hypothetical protein